MPFDLDQSVRLTDLIATVQNMINHHSDEATRIVRV